MAAAGIPTLYKGVRFRSRLEARWAAYFDLVGIGWDYEPIELAGYIPDFTIGASHLGAEFLAEVKPARVLKDTADARLKVERSGWTGGAVVIGNDPRIAMGSWAPQSGCWEPWDSRRLAPGVDWLPAWQRAGEATQWRQGPLSDVERALLETRLETLPELAAAAQRRGDMETVLRLSLEYEHARLALGRPKRPDGFGG